MRRGIYSKPYIFNFRSKTLEYIYAPWRDAYVTGAAKGGCVFCDISANSANDEENTVLYRDEICFAVMNKYPYTPGHFMIIPHFHTDALEELPPQALGAYIASSSKRGCGYQKSVWSRRGKYRNESRARRRSGDSGAYTSALSPKMAKRLKLYNDDRRRKGLFGRF